MEISQQFYYTCYIQKYGFYEIHNQFYNIGNQFQNHFDWFQNDLFYFINAFRNNL